MVTKARGIQNSGLRRRPQSSSTGNPLTDVSIVKGTSTPSRLKSVPAQPIAIPDSSCGARRRHGSPRSLHSASPQSHSYSSSKSSPTRASPSANGFYAGAKFSEAPSAACLPKPPSHWTTFCHDPFQAQSNQLKLLLKIQAWKCTFNPLLSWSLVPSRFLFLPDSFSFPDPLSFEIEIPFSLSLFPHHPQTTS